VTLIALIVPNPAVDTDRPIDADRLPLC